MTMGTLRRRRYCKSIVRVDPDNLDVTVLKTKIKKTFAETNSTRAVARRLKLPLRLVRALLEEMGLQKVVQSYISFKKARNIVRREAKKLRIYSLRDYQSNEMWRQKHRLPTNPDLIYKKKGWAGWLDFLGKDKKNTHRLWPSGTRGATFEEACAIAKRDARKLNISGKTYKQARNEKWRKLQGLPTDPMRTYKKEWKGWPHFLGKERPSFGLAKQLVLQHQRKLKITKKTFSSTQLKKWREKHNLPSCPHQVYSKEWAGWADFLGKTKRPLRRRNKKLLK